MFERKKTILFITKSPARNASQSDAGGKIKIARVTMGGMPVENIIANVDWTPDTMPDILLRFKKDIKNPVRILLSEDFVYTVNVTMPSGSYLRDEVKKRAQELIPEDLDQTIWDFKEMGSPTTVQVIAVAKTLLETLRRAVAKVELQIEAIEPLSFALARFAQAQDPVVYVYRDDGEVTVTLAQKGVVIATERLGNIDLNTLNQFLAFAQRFSAPPKNVIFCGNTSGIDLTSLANENFKAQVLNISPIISLAYKEDIKGKDEQVLNLLFPSSSSQVERSEVRPESPNAIRDAGQASMTKNVKKHNFSKTTILAISLILAIVILVALIIFKVYL